MSRLICYYVFIFLSDVFVAILEPYLNHCISSASGTLSEKLEAKGIDRVDCPAYGRLSFLPLQECKGSPEKDTMR